MRFVPNGDTLDGGIVYDNFEVPAGVDMRRYRAIQAGRGVDGGDEWQDGVVRGRVTGNTADGGIVYDGFDMPAGVDMRRYRAVRAGRAHCGDTEDTWDDGVVRGRVSGNTTDGGIVYDAAAMPRGVNMRAYNATKHNIAKGKATGSGPAVEEWHDGVTTGRVKKGNTLDGGIVCEPVYMPPGVKMPRKKGHVAALNTQELPGGVIGPKSTAGSKKSGFYDLRPPSRASHMLNPLQGAAMVDAGVVLSGNADGAAYTTLSVFTGQQRVSGPRPGRRRSVDANPRAHARPVVVSQRVDPPVTVVPHPPVRQRSFAAGSVEVMDGGVVVTAPTQELFAHGASGQVDAAAATSALDVSCRSV